MTTIQISGETFLLGLLMACVVGASINSAGKAIARAIAVGAGVIASMIGGTKR